MIHNHPHPGEILRDMVFDPLGLTVSDAAERLSMSRPALSRVLNSHAARTATSADDSRSLGLVIPRKSANCPTKICLDYFPSDNTTCSGPK